MSMTIKHLRNISDKYYELRPDRAYLFIIEEASSFELNEFRETFEAAKINGIVCNFSFEKISELTLNELCEAKEIIENAIENYHKSNPSKKKKTRFEILKMEMGKPKSLNLKAVKRTKK